MLLTEAVAGDCYLILFQSSVDCVLIYLCTMIEFLVLLKNLCYWKEEMIKSYQGTTDLLSLNKSDVETRSVVIEKLKNKSFNG